MIFVYKGTFICRIKKKTCVYMTDTVNDLPHISLHDAALLPSWRQCHIPLKQRKKDKVYFLIHYRTSRHRLTSWFYSSWRICCTRKVKMKLMLKCLSTLIIYGSWIIRVRRQRKMRIILGQNHLNLNFILTYNISIAYCKQGCMHELHKTHTPWLSLTAPSNDAPV